MFSKKIHIKLKKEKEKEFLNYKFLKKRDRERGKSGKIKKL